MSLLLVERLLLGPTIYTFSLEHNLFAWPSKEAVEKYMPQEFRTLYPNTRVVIDCTEIRVQVPSSLLLQSQKYSNHKSGTTLKSLIGITPHGAVSFVSSLYTASISDKEITRYCGILDLLDHSNDNVMVDKGFNIGDMLSSERVGLNLPPYLSNGAQFSSKEVKETKTIAKLRFHVERAIRRIKEYPDIYDTYRIVTSRYTQPALDCDLFAC